MVWLKIDGIEMEPDETISSYANPKKVELFTPPAYTLKVKIGDTTLSGKLLNNFIAVDDEKLNTVYDQAKELEKVRDEAYERGRKAGYEDGLARAIDMLQNNIDGSEINHYNCPYRKDVVCGAKNRDCKSCDIYQWIFGKESSFDVCPYLKNDTNGLACVHTETCKGPCELVLSINEESEKEDKECSKEENTSST